MKTTRLFLLATLIAVAFTVQSCKKTEVEDASSTSILPTKFKVNIPSSISASATKSALKSAQANSFSGNEIYVNLKTFIAVGEGAGDMIEKIIGAITVYKINKPMVISFQGDEDQRTKNMVVVENSVYDGKTYKYQLTVTDAASESATDGGKGMQIFWNTAPIEGVAIIKPYNTDRAKNLKSPDAIFRIEYSEVATAEYDSHMIVDIANLTLADTLTDPFSIKTLKMFVGKKGDIVDVYGNSDHPNAKFFTNKRGFNWAFVASGTDSKNFAVAEVGLPPSGLDNSTRKVLLEDYALKTVFTNQINIWFFNQYGIHLDAADLSKYLKNADAPGFFDAGGFIKAGVSPDAKYDPLVARIKALAPYSPKLIQNLTVDFK